MKFNVTYELMSSDKVYYVTKDGTIKTIVLKPQHFDYVHNLLAWPITQSALFNTDETVFFLGSKSFKDTNKRIPLNGFTKVIGYNDEDRFEDAKKNIKFIYDYVYPSLEQAQEIVKNKRIEELKSEIAINIKSIIAVDNETKIPVAVYSNIVHYTQYSDALFKIEKLEKEHSLTTTVSLEDDRNFELSEFKSYVANLLENLSIELDKSQADARESNLDNKIVLPEEYGEQTLETINKLLKQLDTNTNK